MKKNRKTREQKVKSSLRAEKPTAPKPIEASHNTTSKTPSQTKKEETKKSLSKNEDIKKSLIASGVIMALNIIIFILLSSNVVSLGFLGY